MWLSVVIPAWNEARLIGRAIQETGEACERIGQACEIIVVDDGSTDGTFEVAQHATQRGAPVRVIRHEANQGKGAAIRTAVAAAQGEWIVFLDADLSVHPSEIGRLHSAMAHADVIIGSRRMQGASIPEPQPLTRDYAGRIFNLLVRYMIRLSYHDTQCGFKAFHQKTKPLFEALQTMGWAFDVELLVRAQRTGCRIVEIPVTWRHGTESRVKWRDATRILRDLVWIQRRVC